MNWALQRLSGAFWSWRGTRRVALALVVIGGASWLWRSGVTDRLWHEALVFFAPHALSLSLVGGSVIGIALLWVLPKWQARRLAIDGKAQRFELENEARKTVAQILGGAAFLAGLYFTAQTLRIGQETLRVNQEGQITERFTKAIEQLGSKELQVRLGGIYALERIARDSDRDHGPIMEVLTAYVRENAPIKAQPKREEEQTADPVKGSEEARGLFGWKPTPEILALQSVLLAGPPTEEKPTTDIQAILTVLGRRTLRFDRVGTHLDLRSTDLRGANLFKANLRGANLFKANLREAMLQGATLEGAILAQANLDRAYLAGANLEWAGLTGANFRQAVLLQANLHRAILYGADLRGAYLMGANLQKAFLATADLRGANLAGANLREAGLAGAANLTQAQIDQAITDKTTMCPPDLKCKK